MGTVHVKSGKSVDGNGGQNITFHFLSLAHRPKRIILICVSLLMHEYVKICL